MHAKKNPTNSCQIRDHDMYNIFSNLFSIIRMCGHDMYNIFPIYLGLIRIRAHDMYSFSNICYLFSDIHVRNYDAYNSNISNFIRVQGHDMYNNDLFRINRHESS